MVPKKAKRVKPKKPRKDWPLSAHPCGQWCKNVSVNGKQRTIYLGKWEDPEAALQEWLRVKDHILAGTNPPVDVATIADLLDEFLGRKKQSLDLGELTEDSWAEILRVTDKISDHFGPRRPLDNLDLVGLRGALSKGSNGKQVGPVTLKRRLSIARSVFKFGEINTRGELKKPPERILRKARTEVGAKWYSAEEVRALLDHAQGDLKAFVLLGIMAGFGPADCCEVPRSAFSGEWIRFPRPKTGIERVAYRWPELVDDLLPGYGERNWSRFYIANEWRELCKRASVPNHGHYSLRRTLETVMSGGPISQHVIDRIMGHVTEGMGAVYRQKVSGIRAASEWLRGWVHGENQLER